MKSAQTSILHLFKPAPFVERLPEAEIEPAYKQYRMQMLLTIFFGYAGYYLVRTNINVAKPYLISQLGFSKGDVGLLAAALTVAYGISKFVSGNFSDRSNPRYFLATGLIASGIINLLFGFLPGLVFMIVFWFLNGWFQGMGWPPCARTIVHWFSDKERGTKMAIWNLAHNVGGMLAPVIASYAITSSGSWKGAFFVPAIASLLAGVGVILFLRDTPQSVGLPPIEEFTNDYPATAVDDRERELSGTEILFKYVLNNKFLWIFAAANVLVYIVRYGVVNWAPTYLTEVKGYSITNSAWQSFLYELAGIPGMLFSGWASDKLFHGRRSPIMVIFMALVTGAILLYWLNPKGNYLVDSISLIAIGFLIYGPVMLIGIAAVDLVPKKAAGTAAGLTGLFGYVGATGAELGIGKIVEHFGWNAGFMTIIAAAVLSIALLCFTWNVHDRRKEHALPG
ncbi:MAG: phosphoglycerate transporter protein PgtP [Candidatus Obscuribacterales bacterium]|nr:phosphoglycerate transporter protein PgtP [Candidatus Obscuribacterales bacterium]